MNDRKTFIITGTSRGLGKDLAKHYLANSINIIGISRSASTIDHQNYVHFSTDIGDEIKVKKLFRYVRKNYSNIHCLINNAAISYSNNILLTSTDEINKIMKTNFLGTFIMSKEAIKIMKNNSFGRIISISSILSKKNLPGTSIYSISKIAIEKFQNLLRVEINNSNISFDIVRLSAIENIGMSNKISDEAKKTILNNSVSKKTVTLKKIIDEFDLLIFSKNKNLDLNIE